MAKLEIYLNEHHFDALRILAKQEYRDPRAQAAIIICRELEHAGLLVAGKVSKHINIDDSKQLEQKKGGKP